MPPLEGLETAGLLQDAANFIRRFCVIGQDQLVVLALWCAHTHAFDAAHTTPYIHVASSERRSGKTRVKEAVALLVREPLTTSNISEAALYRVIQERTPTVFLDEIDTVFSPKARDREDFRGMLNEGFQSGGKIVRCGGKNNTELHEFSVFAPKMLLGIGLALLPDTVSDRCIVVETTRKTASDTVERFRRRQAAADADVIRQGFESWAQRAVPLLVDAEPDLPDFLDDRAADGWEALLAIADLAGEGWPEAARAAARTIAKLTRDDDQSIRVQLLAACRRVFDERAGEQDGDRISTRDLIEQLAADEEGPFVKWWNGVGPEPWAPRQLSKHLSEHRIHSNTLRFATGPTLKGYRAEQFTEAWARYLPAESVASVAPVTDSYSSQKAVTDTDAVTDGIRYTQLATEVPA